MYSTETYTERTIKDLVCKREELKCKNKINLLTLMILQEKQ